METFLIRALQLVMSLSLLVIVHEGGHFLFARLFKTRVESPNTVTRNTVSDGYP